MNLLSRETSPYLRQHMDNPVDWMPWGDAALEKARAEGKPILLSVGYAACHWCHVMAHESFEDAGTADLMNRDFINIKVDREERPDVDAVFQSALSLMGQAGGWPLTMFLTPDGKPFWGGTYFPPQPRHGMPSFREVLRGVADAYTREKDKIAHNVQSLDRALRSLHTGQPGLPVHRDRLDRITAHILTLIDPAHGGIGTAPKFPCLPAMGLLWDSYIRTGETAYKAAVIHSLTQMCQGGIYDHAGGGFARYATDEEWLAPHFEKMLYDNALFIGILSEVYKETRHPLFARRVRETVAWLREEMTVRDQSVSAFASSLDADSEGKEGKYYIWTAEEIDQVLGADAMRFSQFYDVVRFGNWHGVNILNRLRHPDYLSEAEEDAFAAMLQKLKADRQKRVPPARDDKVLAEWNGLIIAALAQAAQVFGEDAWRDMAANAFSFITRNMMEKDGRLHRVWSAGAAHVPATLEDYAQMAQAALALGEVRQAQAWADIAAEGFWDDAAHGYFMTHKAARDLTVRPKSAQDSALPAGNGAMIGVLTRLYYLTGEAHFLDRAEKTLAAFSGEVQQQTFPFATLLRNGDLLLNPLYVCLVTPAGADDAALAAVLDRLSLPHLICDRVTADAVLPKNHPAAGKTAVEGRATVYVCLGQHCLAPVTEAAELEKLLRESRQGRATANDG